MRALETLLAELIDYAGLFPPAGLGMADAVANYAAYRASGESWMLGRFVLPAARLTELASFAGPHVQGDVGWRLSALLGADPEADLDRVAAFHREHAGTSASIAVDSLEAKVAAPGNLAELRRLIRALGSWPLGEPLLFAELPAGADVAPFANAAREAGVALKLRTGGVTVDAFPSAGVVLDFLAGCVRQRVPFKLTAGLHHPLRGEHPLTYEPACPRGTMFGFLTVFGAAALLVAGAAQSDVAPLLDERDAAAIAFDGEALVWRGRRAGLTDLAAARRLARSFGSCSFEEPVQDLRALGLLPRPTPLLTHT